MTSKKIKFCVFNIKLQTKLKGEDRTKRYIEIVDSLATTKKYTRISKTHAITMYPPYKREQKEVQYLYGAISKGISFFDKEEIEIVDNDNYSKEPVNKDRLIEPVSSQYIFIPSIHRMAMVVEPNSITINELQKFLSEHLSKLALEEELIEVDYEREPSIIEEIFKAKAVFKVNYNISYSNNDAFSAQGELFDKLLHDNNIGNLSVSAKADHSTEGMNLNVDFLGGGLDVAKNNGTIKSAEIIADGEKKKRVVTNENKPKILDIELLNENDNIQLRIYNLLSKLYKK